MYSHVLREPSDRMSVRQSGTKKHHNIILTVLPYLTGASGERRGGCAV